MKKVKVLNLDNVPDSRGETFNLKGLTIEKEVPVYFNYQRDLRGYLGTAKLTRTARAVYATLSLINRGIHGAAVMLYPAVGGRETKRKGTVIEKCTINELGLCTTPNQDRRIKPIKVRV